MLVLRNVWKSQWLTLKFSDGAPTCHSNFFLKAPSVILLSTNTDKPATTNAKNMRSQFTWTGSQFPCRWHRENQREWTHRCKWLRLISPYRIPSLIYVRCFAFNICRKWRRKSIIQAGQDNRSTPLYHKSTIFFNYSKLTGWGQTFFFHHISFINQQQCSELFKSTELWRILKGKNEHHCARL